MQMTTKSAYCCCPSTATKSYYHVQTHCVICYVKSGTRQKNRWGTGSTDFYALIIDTPSNILPLLVRTFNAGFNVSMNAVTAAKIVAVPANNSEAATNSHPNSGLGDGIW